MALKASVAATTKPKLPGYCSICWCADGNRGKHLQDCSECGVLFHNECYGREGIVDYNPALRCWPCLAVGTTVHGRSLDGTRQDVVVTERPTECALCSADLRDIPLAMHPLYDDHGIKGRQLLLKDRSAGAGGTTALKPAWCHTLCAQFTCSFASTKGCVYGCTASGMYTGDDDFEVEDDERSYNSQLQQAMNDSPLNDTGSVHHFVVVLKTWRGANEWTKRVDQSKKNLRCYICQKNDNRLDTVRFAVQCSANEPTEMAGKGRHKDKSLCTEAIHVGCAIWQRGPKGNWMPHRQVYFFPGTTENDDQDVVADIYCRNHARDLANSVGAWKSVKYRRFPEPNDKFPFCKQKAIRADAAGQDSVQSKSSSSPSQLGPAARRVETVDVPHVRPSANGASATKSSVVPPGKSSDANMAVGDDRDIAASKRTTREENKAVASELRGGTTTAAATTASAVIQTGTAASTEDQAKKRYKRSSLIRRKGANSSNGEGLVIERGSPVHWPVKKDWSRLFVGPNYDPKLLDLTTWDMIEPVDADDISDD